MNIAGVLTDGISRRAADDDLAEGKFLLSVPLKTGAANYMAEMTDIGGMGDTVEAVRDRRFVEWRPELTVRSGESPSLGLEINARPRADWIFNATLNPDFSQVEIDEPTNGASRIAPSLPEKRGFFLESSDVLGLPLAPFYSRTVAAPEWGMRATWPTATGSTAAMAMPPKPIARSAVRCCTATCGGTGVRSRWPGRPTVRAIRTCSRRS